ncbi:MAG: zf-HC2 domain-containing protein [Acidobacteriaceae bacterium]|nr:zf-HC2 domain-containing protein [Acidobacteriaceae bacterium]
MPEPNHIGQDELLALVDGELTPEHVLTVEAHLRDCASCRAEFAAFLQASVVYAQFHEELLEPNLTPQIWPALRLPKSRSSAVYGWMGALAAVIAIAALMFVHQRHPQPSRFQEILDRSEVIPPRPHERIQVTAAGLTWIRSASHNDRRVAALFIKAHYNWDDPLSARSFASWRKLLRHKRDRLSSLSTGDGQAPLYVIRTETDDSSLRFATLTLRSNDLAALKGAFRFEGDQDVELNDVGPESPAAPAAPSQNPTPLRESAVTPADELRVMAALNEIGADVNDPLTVQTDATKRHVIVTGVGIQPSRQNEIRRKLLALPRTLVTFLSHAPLAHPPASGNFLSTDANSDARRFLEDRAGGPRQLETIAEKSLDASTYSLAYSHALDVLADKFPAAVESTLNSEDRATLLLLRHRHAAAVEHNSAQLADSLRPLLPARPQSQATVPQSYTSWQAEAGKLYEDARRLDDTVSHLLGGLLSKEQTERALASLPDAIENVQTQARAEAAAQ